MTTRKQVQDARRARDEKPLYAAVPPKEEEQKFIKQDAKDVAGVQAGVKGICDALRRI